MPEYSRKIPLLKALAKGDRLIPGSREGARQPDDDGWWQSVLEDRRARVPTAISINRGEPFERYRLDMQRDGQIILGCQCGWFYETTKAALIEKFGISVNILYAAKKLGRCGSKLRDWEGEGCKACVVTPTKSGIPFKYD